MTFHDFSSITSSQDPITHYQSLAHSVSFHTWGSQIAPLFNMVRSRCTTLIVFPVLLRDPIIPKFSQNLSSSPINSLLCRRRFPPSHLSKTSLSTRLWGPCTLLCGHPADQPLPFLPLSSFLLTYAYIIFSWKTFLIQSVVKFSLSLAHWQSN